jgi:carbonic anhydrase
MRSKTVTGSSRHLPVISQNRRLKRENRQRKAQYQAFAAAEQVVKRSNCAALDDEVQWVARGVLVEQPRSKPLRNQSPGMLLAMNKASSLGVPPRLAVTYRAAGGRAAFALESVAAMDYIFNVKNVVVVHHSFCGTTTLTPELIVEEFHDHHDADISTLFDHDSLAIMDFEESLDHDIKLLRKSPAVPKHIKLYGFFYEISSGKLTEVVRDIPA